MGLSPMSFHMKKGGDWGQFFLCGFGLGIGDILRGEHECLVLLRGSWGYVGEARRKGMTGGMVRRIRGGRGGGVVGKEVGAYGRCLFSYVCMICLSSNFFSVPFMKHAHLQELLCCWPSRLLGDYLTYSLRRGTSLPLAI